MIICRALTVDLSAFAKGERNDRHNLSRGRDLNRRPSAQNPRASALDHSSPHLVTIALLRLCRTAEDYMRFEYLTGDSERVWRFCVGLLNVSVYSNKPKLNAPNWSTRGLVVVSLARHPRGPGFNPRSRCSENSISCFLKSYCRLGL